MNDTSTMLKEGDRIPSFSLPNQDDELTNIDQFIGQPLIIYFYPKNDTPGCINEACQFRDQFEVFEDHGASIVGISGDSPKSHKRFAARYNLNFTLLSDQKREAEKMFGVPRTVFGLLPGRVTFVIDPEGIVRHTFSAQFNPKQHIDEALRVLETFS